MKRKLSNFGVSSYKKCRKNRDVYLLRICGREDLENFYNKVGFNHLKKEESLKLALASYQKYYGNSWEPPHIEDRKTAEKFLTDFFAERGYFRVKKQGYGSFEIGLHNSKAITEISTLLQKYFNIDLSVSTTPDKQDRCWIWISRISELEKLLESGLLRNAPEKENSLRTFVTSRD